MPEETKLDLSKFDKKNRDHALNFIKALISQVPGGGGIISSLIGDYIPSTVERRKEELLLQLSKDLEVLKGKFLTEVITKDMFITIFIEAFKEAVLTHQKEKINAYRSIILNTLISSTYSEDEVAVYINLTQRLTPLHIKLLKILSNPEKEIQLNPDAKAQLDTISMGGLSTLTSSLLPGYQEDLIETVFNDLRGMGFHNTSQFHMTMTKNGILQKRTNEFADRYLNFITLPQSVADEEQN